MPHVFEAFLRRSAFSGSRKAYFVMACGADIGSAGAHLETLRATDACVSCGQCAQACPMNNITLAGGRPVWGGACTHCMACISLCPKGAIEYGRGTVGRRRYRCPERMENQG